MSAARVALIALPALVAACTFGPQESSRFDETTSVTVTVFDEHGDPVAGAAVDVTGGPDVETDRQGEVELSLSRPIVAVVTAPGALPLKARPGMIVCIGRFPGATTLGWVGSSRKARPRLWNNTPVSGHTRPEPKPS